MRKVYVPLLAFALSGMSLNSMGQGLTTRKTNLPMFSLFRLQDK